MEHEERSPTFVNLSDPERIASLMGGGLLAFYGIGRRDRLGIAIAIFGGAMAIRGVQGHSNLYDRLGVRRFAGAEGEGNAIRGQAIRVEHSIVVDRPVDDVYRFWRAFENLPRFMNHLVSVTALPSGLHRWVAKAPVGTVEWEAEILEEQVPWLISWRSVPGSEIENAGSVRFAPAPQGGTEVRVELAYKPPAGVLGAAVARLLGEEPHVQVRDDLRRFKEIVESGELASGEVARQR